MNCEESRTWLAAHLDDELDVAASIGMEQHLSECPDCRRVYAEGLAIRDAMRGGDLIHEPPPRLAKTIRASVAKAARQERAPGMFTWQWVAAGAMALGVFLTLVVLRTGSQPPLVAELVAGHVRSLQADHLVDVASSDRHTVKPWFQGKLDFSPPVPDLPELTGGRLDYVKGRPVAALVYQRRQHRINVFVWPGTGPERITVEHANGYQIVHWFGEGMEWWAVSDMNGDELREFAKNISGNNSRAR